MFGNNVNICASKIQIFLISATDFADKYTKNLRKRFFGEVFAINYAKCGCFLRFLT